MLIRLTLGPAESDDDPLVALCFLLVSDCDGGEKAEGGSRVLSRASWLADAHSTSHPLDG